MSCFLCALYFVFCGDLLIFGVDTAQNHKADNKHCAFKGVHNGHLTKALCLEKRGICQLCLDATL